MKFNINKYVKVRVTPYGRSLLEKQHAELMEMIPECGRHPFRLDIDQDGYSKFQLWDLMSRLGQYCQMGVEQPFETEVVFEI